MTLYWSQRNFGTKHRSRFFLDGWVCLDAACRQCMLDPIPPPAAVLNWEQRCAKIMADISAVVDLLAGTVTEVGTRCGGPLPFSAMRPMNPRPLAPPSLLGRQQAHHPLPRDAAELRRVRRSCRLPVPAVVDLCIDRVKNHASPRANG